MQNFLLNFWGAWWKEHGGGGGMADGEEAFLQRLALQQEARAGNSWGRPSIAPGRQVAALVHVLH